VESGSREENASNQEAGVFHRFHETVKDSSALGKWGDPRTATARNNFRNDRRARIDFTRPASYIGLMSNSGVRIPCQQAPLRMSELWNTGNTSHMDIWA
jgi:hypothetical protein